jgi:hypothetical protein
MERDMRDYKAELREATAELRATMAAYRGDLDTRARIERKGSTLLVIRGERSALKVRL